MVNLILHKLWRSVQAQVARVTGETNYPRLSDESTRTQWPKRTVTNLSCQLGRSPFLISICRCGCSVLFSFPLDCSLFYLFFFLVGSPLTTQTNDAECPLTSLCGQQSCQRCRCSTLKLITTNGQVSLLASPSRRCHSTCRAILYIHMYIYIYCSICLRLCMYFGDLALLLSGY